MIRSENQDNQQAYNVQGSKSKRPVKLSLNKQDNHKTDKIEFTEKGDVVEGNYIIGKNGVKIKNKGEEFVSTYLDSKHILDNLKMEDLQKECALGQGSSGIVEKMIHIPTEKTIALKKIHLETNDEKFKKNLKVELDTLMKCDSEYVVQFYGAFYEQANIYIAMEYMDEGSLAYVLKKAGSISEIILGLIAYQVLNGLEYLHKQMKLIHRDIKPSNLLINSQGQVKISDFGVSGQIDFTQELKTSFVGTVTYMSPERLQGESYLHDTDLWSLGISLIECAIGKYPYVDPQRDATPGFWDLIQIINTQPPPELPETFSKEFRDFVSVCLQKEKGKRSSAQELLKHPWIKKYQGKSYEAFAKWLKLL